jgi:hypothetical protein
MFNRIFGFFFCRYFLEAIRSQLGLAGELQEKDFLIWEQVYM